jgi:hypothetical protein
MGGRDCGDGFTAYKVALFQFECKVINYNGLTNNRYLVVRVEDEQPD